MKKIETNLIKKDPKHCKLKNTIAILQNKVVFIKI